MIIGTHRTVWPKRSVGVKVVSINGGRSRAIVGGALLLIGAVASLSQFAELPYWLRHGTAVIDNATTLHWFMTSKAVYGTHSVAIAVAGWLVLRGSKRAVWVLWFAVLGWVTGVMVDVWFARRFAIDQGQTQPLSALFLRWFTHRFLIVLPSIVGLIYLRTHHRKEDRSCGESPA